MKSKPTTTKYPTPQSVVECLHLTLGYMLQAFIYTEDTWQDDIDHLILSVTWALWTTTLSNISYNPGQLVFGMDMIFHMKIKVDWQILKEKRCFQAIANNDKENWNHRTHQYKVGGIILLVNDLRKQTIFTYTRSLWKYLIVCKWKCMHQARKHDKDVSIHRLCPYHAKNN